MRQAEVFENERYMPMMGWGAKFLLPTDRRHYSIGRKDTGGGLDFPDLPLPAGVAPHRLLHRHSALVVLFLNSADCHYKDLSELVILVGWEWEGAWQMDLSGNVDKDGWTYASDFTFMGFPPQRVSVANNVSSFLSVFRIQKSEYCSRSDGACICHTLQGAGSKSMMDFVRRRRWVRNYCHSGTSSATTAATPIQLPGSAMATGAARSASDAGAAEGVERLLGIVQPGATLPLPQDWHIAGQQLQVSCATLGATKIAFYLPP